MKRRTYFSLFASMLTILLLGCAGSPKRSEAATSDGGAATAEAETAETAEAATAETTAAAEAETAETAETTAAAETAVTAETTATAEAATTEAAEEAMRIKVETNGNEIIFELNNSQAAKDLYRQLPMTVENEDFSNNEKTFYPPEKLDINDAPATDGSVGTLAYYEPWGDVVLFYGTYRSNDALYALGKVVSGSEYISEISGEMIISQEIP